MKKDTATVQEFNRYINGWLGADHNPERITLKNMRSVLRNALAMIGDKNDGIFPFIEREKELRERLGFDRVAEVFKSNNKP